MLAARRDLRVLDAVPVSLQAFHEARRVCAVQPRVFGDALLQTPPARIAPDVQRRAPVVEAAAFRREAVVLRLEHVVHRPRLVRHVRRHRADEREVARRRHSRHLWKERRVELRAGPRADARRANAVEALAVVLVRRNAEARRRWRRAAADPADQLHELLLQRHPRDEVLRALRGAESRVAEREARRVGERAGRAPFVGGRRGGSRRNKSPDARRRVARQLQQRRGAVRRHLPIYGVDAVVQHQRSSIRRVQAKAGGARRAEGTDLPVRFIVHPLLVVVLLRVLALRSRRAAHVAIHSGTLQRRRPIRDVEAELRASHLPLNGVVRTPSTRSESPRLIGRAVARREPQSGSGLRCGRSSERGNINHYLARGRGLDSSGSVAV